MSRNYRGSSSSSYHTNRGGDRERDHEYDGFKSENNRYYDGKYRNYYHWDERRSGTSNQCRDRSPSTHDRRHHDDRSRRERYYPYVRDRDAYINKNRDRDKDRDRSIHERDRYRSGSLYRGISRERYGKHHSSNKDRNDYYKSDRYIDKDDHYKRDRDNNRNRDKYCNDDFDMPMGSKEDQKRNKRYDNEHYDKASTPIEELGKDNFVAKDVILYTPPLPTTDPHFPDAYEATENVIQGSGYESKPIDDHPTDPYYKDYATALLAGTSIKTGMYLGSSQKLLFKKPQIEALKSTPSNTNTIVSVKSSMTADNNIPLIDPRNKNVTIGKRVVSLFDCVRLPLSHRAVTTLDSPIVDFYISGIDICNMMYDHKFVVSPLEKLNRILYRKIPSVKTEKWVSGCKTILVMGIPRHLTSQEALQLLVEVYHKSLVYDGRNIIYDDDWLSDEEIKSSTNPSRVIIKRRCNKNLLLFCGIAEFHLLFGDSNRAKNSLDTHYPQSTWRSTATSYDGTTIKIPDAPNAMALVVFYSESKAKDFWMTINSSAVHVHSCIIQCLPDPMGLRIFAEALSSSFNPDLLIQKKSNTKLAQPLLQQYNIKKEPSGRNNLRVKTEPNEPTPNRFIPLQHINPSIYCWKLNEPNCVTSDCDIIVEDSNCRNIRPNCIKNESESIENSGDSKMISANIKIDADLKSDTCISSTTSAKVDTVNVKTESEDPMYNTTERLDSGNDIRSHQNSSNITFIAPIINTDICTADELSGVLRDVGFRADVMGDIATFSCINENIMQIHCVHSRVFYTPDDNRILCLFIKFNDSIIPLIQNQCVIKFNNFRHSSTF
ncbi:hypothetical protein BMR1_02g01395 [Babesia microti strain RI]|uniref:Uncharacterized protein n=1 Tax=Babesia microti (strain RI) TaxID=1133968 RepID=I7IQ34_BABMR|nr:hypothetical protein BMR1_02g01395 [Babesia microti strain RI]CCF73440.1 hypothetical protein BMR1_02g01395 [Babesia microti strain RI]|eukprot:XP_012648049.1 hypothetical protein BMR1_02g01395 [Babesia microti strain RI]